MRDVKSPNLMWLKGILFLVIGTASAGLLWMQSESLTAALLLAATIWGFCRAYYFAFYVLERYIDPEYRFAGLCSLVRYLLKARRKRAP
jgi:hypothetical protein